MTSLPSNSQADFTPQKNDNRNGLRPPKKSKRQPNANSASVQQQPNPNTDHTARKRHLRYSKSVRINERATGDNADTLRQKRRWVQKEFEASRLSGKATRELHDLYSKRNIGRIEHQRRLAQDLTKPAKEAKERLEEVFGKGGPLFGDGALGEPSNGEDLSEISGDEAMVDTESAGNMQTAGVNTSTGDTYRLAAFPYYYSIDNDALAKQKALALGLELADYTVSDQGPGARMEGEDGVEVKMEEGHEVEIKMEVEDE